MARMHEVIDELQLPKDRIPELWEPYFVAAQQKYAQPQENRDRYSLNWYRQLNRWLDFNEIHMELILAAASRITQQQSLYQWSCFVRYLLYDTLIIRKDEKLLHNLLPKDRLPAASQDLFFLVSMLSGADRSIDEYKASGKESKQIEAAFGIVKVLLDNYHRIFHRWGTPVEGILPRLAWGSLLVYEGLAFEYTHVALPGRIYRNARSGELVMLADGGQLYDKNGFRLPAREEQRLLSSRLASEPLIDEAQLSKQTEPGAQPLTAANQLPEDIWETKFFNTESGGFVGNILGPDGMPRSSVRIFESGHWMPVLDDSSPILKLYVPDESFARRERLAAAASQAITAARQSKLDPKAIILESWLLDPRLVTYLPADAELLAFVREFKLYPLPLNSEESFLQTYGEDISRRPLLQWPETTPTALAMKTMVRDGYPPTRGGGYLLSDTLPPAENNDKTDKVEKIEKKE